MNSSPSNRMVSLDVTAGGRLTVDLRALAANWREIADRVGPSKAGAAIKGNGYGLGIEPVARALTKAGCGTFFVALAEEGARVRTVAPEADIYVLNGLAGGAAKMLAAAKLRPVLGCRDELEEWAGSRPDGARAALHVDTGMNRLGVTLEEAAALSAEAGRAEALGIALLLSHLFCADQPDHPATAIQLQRFTEIRARFPGVQASLANSAGVFRGEAFHFDLVRPGIALYGGAFSRDRGPLRNVATLEARIVQVRDVEAGQTIGYGAAQATERRSRIAILSTGYADGYHRLAGSSSARAGAQVFLHGRRAPLIGRVSMDLTAIDVTEIAEAARGDWVELFGPNIAVDEVATIAETIGYELLAGLGSRYQRNYVGDE